MSASTTKQGLLKSVWAISSIFDGLHEYSQTWDVFSPKSEPFWAELSKLDSCRSVYAACRGVTLACEGNQPAVVFVPNRQIAKAMKYASEAIVESPLILVVEDHPLIAPHLFPRESAMRAGLCVVEPCTPSEVTYCTSAAVKLSLSTSRPVVFIAHHGILGGSASIESSNLPDPQSSRQPADAISPIRLGRKLELNRQRTLPSPGEKISVGFITVGMSDPALKYLVSELQLLGRVPMLNLRMIHPLDAVPVERLISRCRHVVVLEPRPGEVEQKIISIAQSMQREGGEVAAIWGSELPPIDPELEPVKVPVDSLHPSVVARLTQHLLHDVKPSAQVSLHLLPTLPDLNILSTRRTSFGTSAALKLLRETSINVFKSLGTSNSLVIDGKHCIEGEEDPIYVETWGEHNFISEGADVVRDARNQSQTRILLVWRSNESNNTLSMIVESITSAKGDDQNSVVEVSLDNREELDTAIVAACRRKGISIILVNDGAEPQFDVEKLTETAADIDKRGFRPQQAIVIPVEQMASVRITPIEPLQPVAGVPAMPLESTLSSRWIKNQGQKIRFSLRPLLERVEVTRIKPPVRVVAQTSKRVSPPQPIHASSPTWRVHIAGSRGDQPGVVGKILMEAGRQMGYEICSQCNSAFVGAGRRAWTQILFTRKQTTRSFRPLVASIPWGEADLLLGWDREEVLRSIDPKRALQVASPQRTYAIINTDPLERQSSLADVEGSPASINISTISTSCKTDTAVVRSFAFLARYRFHNERLGDVIQLGMAFQMGLIPATVDAINAAVAMVEKEGFARSIESFNFGRQVALDPENAWQPVKEELQVDLSKMMKRSVRDYYKLGKRGVSKAETIERLIIRAKQSLSGLVESTDGRQVMVDLINGLRRCMLWGGEETADIYLDSIQKIYDVDRVETGRLLTRKAVLPIAEVILIRDPIYLAQLARSPEILRRIRSRLNVRLSRGDTLKRRFLSRIRIGLWNWSLQIDLRTSDWSSAIVSWIGKIIPNKWRGHKRNKAIRDEVLAAVRLATLEPEKYEVWVERFKELHNIASTGNLQSSSLLEIKKILQG